MGSWNAVYELLPRDASGNVEPRATPSAWTRTTISWTPAGKLVALLGVRNLIVVDTPDALLVAAATAPSRWARSSRSWKGRSAKTCYSKARPNRLVSSGRPAAQARGPRWLMRANRMLRVRI